MAARKTTTETTEVIIYVRVSTGEQADSGLGCEAQEACCRGWAAGKRLAVAGVFRDAGVSAKTLDRPELDRAIAALKPGRVLVAYRVDRFTRTLMDFPVLVKRVEATGAGMATVDDDFNTSTAIGRAMLSIVLTFSQLEREQTIERTVAALGAKKVRGERLGTTPLGYETTSTGQVVVNEKEQATVARARELHREGNSLRDICKLLTKEGHQTKRGGTWAPATVRLLLQPRYLETMAAAV